ncbi:MAG: TonB-dependent receptor [Schleiferiaceae bacterium]|nr:TonB-dependent receptor [Schleiferiaceae bacterium]
MLFSERDIFHSSFLSVVLVSMFLILGSNAFGQHTGNGISGKISSVSGAIPAAIIEINHPPFQVITDSSGYYQIPHLLPGKYSLIIYAEGFVTQVHEIDVVESHQTYNFLLTLQHTQLSTVSVVGSAKIESPQATTLQEIQLDREYFEKQNAINFSQSLEKNPGLSTINTGVGIGKPVIRGMSFNRILINDRGIKQEGQQWGADHGLEIDPFNVDEVSIVKGPASLIYGADGMGGVINLLPGTRPKNDTLFSTITSAYQSVNDLYATSISTEAKRGKWHISGRFTHQNFGNYRVPAENFTYAGFVLPIFDNRLTNTAGREHHFSTQATYVGKTFESSLTVSQFQQNAGLFVGAVGIPNSNNLRHFGEQRNVALPNQNNRHLKVISNNTIRISESDYLEIDLGFQRNEREENSLPHTHGYGPEITSNLALGLYLNTITANIRYHKQINTATKSILGVQIQSMSNQFDGFEFLVPEFTSHQSGAFYFIENQTTQQLALTVGARIDAAQHRITQHEQPIYRNRVFTGEYDLRNPDIFREMGNISGSVGARYEWTANTTIKANLGSSFRMPTPTELSMNGVHHGNFRHEVGNANLTPERGYQIDVNIVHKRNRWSFTVSPFWGYYDDFIYLAPSVRFSPLPGAGAFWEYKQHHAIFTGGEALATLELWDGMLLTAGFEYVWNLNLETGLPLPLTPPLSTLLQAEYQFFTGRSKKTRLSFFIDYRIAAAQNRTDRNERTTPGYQLLDAGVQWRYHHLKLQLSGANLANTNYFNHLSRYRLINLPEPGRNVSLRLIVPIGIL